jgi:hypothetical protein
MREAVRQAVAIVPEPAVVAPPKPAETKSTPPPPPFQGNRKARRAAELKARQARRS